MKRLIAVLTITCLVAATPVCASAKTHKLKASGEYSAVQMSGKKEIKSSSELSKNEKKKALKLYDKNPMKFYKKYKKKLWLNYGVFKTKLSNNTLTVWGKLSFKGNGTKKKYKVGKYKFTLSKDAKITYGRAGDNGTILETYSVKQTRKALKNPGGLSYTFFVSGGKIYKISCSS